MKYLHNIAIATSLLALSTGATLAQNAMPPNSSQSGSGSSVAPGSNMTAPGAAGSTTGTRGGATSDVFFTGSLGTAQMEASDLMGKTVYNTNNENIGTISELLVNRSGQIEAVIIGVGGFLGLGERNVAVRFNALQMTPAENNDQRITINLDKRALESAPVYNPSTMNSRG